MNSTYPEFGGSRIKTRNLFQLTVVLLLTAFCAGVATCLGQGSLTPPGPPGPTMLTLSQLQARTPVDAVHTPGNANGEFAITNPGSYYLTTNIVGVSGKDGIDIYTNNVTLDLNGFSLWGVASGGYYQGVQVFPGCTNVTVQNGAIGGWSEHGIYSQGNNVTLEHLSVSENSYYGIVLVNVSTVRYCMTSANRYIGIAVLANGCLVADNTCSGDDWGNSSSDGGIIVEGNYNRIENNHVTGLGGGYGIGVETFAQCTNNIIVRNSVEGSGTSDYSFNSLQAVGPVITNTVSGIITNSNPWANFGF